MLRAVGVAVRLVVRLLGRAVFEVSTDPEQPERPIESNAGGQFEIGFTSPPPGEVVCRRPGPGAR